MKKFIVICLDSLDANENAFAEGTFNNLSDAEECCAYLRNPENKCGSYGASAKVIMVEF